jgi:hypothetical protein
MGNISIKAKLVEAESADHWINALREPGTFLWVDEAHEIAPPGKEARMYFCCPCGCGGHGSAPVRAGGPKTKSPEWDWDGEREEPTLNPSVHFNKGGHGEWHGWLRQGRWEGC